MPVGQNITTSVEFFKLGEGMKAMEQRTLKNVNNYLNTNIYSYLETHGG